MVNAALQDANAEIIRRSAIDAENRGMATTLTAVYLTHEKCYFGHAGDSRCYLIRDNSIELITRDQSIGRVLQQAVGADPRLLPVSGERDLKSGDRVLICSDGLWNAVDDSSILKIVRKKRNLAEACDELVKEANRKGGNDNISMGIARV
ncbi:MAG: serine/threonine-protein phosphatase [Thaumarchaeota archaeon]|nr:serine/threonine-protein phosphatase [Nitrososphaerota archaeon]